jgi:hypothetical protein
MAMMVAFCSAAAVYAQQSDALTLRVYPRIATAESNANVRMRVERDARSRSVELEWWSAEGAGGSHLINLEGSRAAVHHEFPIKRLEPGEYEIVAVLTRDDGSRVRRTTTLTVSGMPRGEVPGPAFSGAKQ